MLWLCGLFFPLFACFSSGILFWGRWRGMFENKFFSCLSCLLLFLKCWSLRQGTVIVLCREDFHMCCSKLCSTFVLIGTSLGTQFKLCRSLANISFRSYMLQLLRWVQFWAQVRKAGVESCTQVWEVLAGECCKTEWEELRATQVSFQVLNNRIL